MPATTSGSRWQTLQFAPYWQLDLQAAGSDETPTHAQYEVYSRLITHASDLEAGLWRDILQSISPPNHEKIMDAYFDDERDVIDGLNEAAVIIIVDYDGDERARYGLGMSSLAFKLVRAATSKPWAAVGEETKKRLLLGASVYVGLDWLGYSVAAMQHDALDDPILGAQGQVRAAIAKAMGNSAQAEQSAPHGSPRFCSSCGERLDESARFCSTCGASVP